jgi:peptidoglycan L-alanyl-D-glutamate endopeptidase CwlK
MLDKMCGLHPYVKIKVLRLIGKSRRVGIDVVVVDSFRSLFRQKELYDIGRKSGGSIVTNNKAGNSYHNYGLAVDIKCSPLGSFCFDSDREMYDIVGDIGKKMGFCWGGDSGYDFDIGHFSFSGGISLEDLKGGKLPFEDGDLRRFSEDRKTKCNVYVRRFPLSFSKIIGIIPENTKLKVYMFDSGWAEIVFCGKRAFVRELNLK